MTKDISIAVVIITESGRLEGESKMLIESIRQFGGQFSNVPIYSYQPRSGFRISNQTLSFFEKNKVHYNDIELNKDYSEYPLVNKILVGEHAEKNLSEDIIVFMDSDKFVWKEPSAFYELEDFDVGFVPVFRKIGWASNGKDHNFTYWQQMFSLYGIEELNYVNTVVDNQRVLTYYNSGLQLIKRKADYYQTARENFERLISTRPDLLKFRPLEQANYTATALGMQLKIKQLGKGYNYPLAYHGAIKNPKYTVNSLSEVTTGHYTTLFKRAGYRNPLRGKIVEGEKGEWLRKKAKEHQVYIPWYKRIF